MIVWSGFGALTALITVMTLVGGVFLDLQFTKLGIPAPTGVVLAWIAGAAVNSIVGRRLNG